MQVNTSATNVRTHFGDTTFINHTLLGSEHELFCDVCTLTCVLVMQNRASDSNIVVIMQGKSKALQVHQWGFVYCIIRLRDSYFKASFYSIKLYFVSENVFFFMYSL